MKYIYISRHAKSSCDHLGTKDFDRPLNERGHHDAPAMAKLFEKNGYSPEILLSSPANRALTTAEYYSERFQLPITQVTKLYHGIPEDYLLEIQNLPDHVESVMLFGHNPGITYIANLIQSNCTDNIPTAGVIIASCAVSRWEDVDWHKCQLKKILTPKEL